MSDAIGRLRQALVTWCGSPALVLLFVLAAMMPGTAAAQATSNYCPNPFTATINSGGSVTFEVGNCDGPSDIGMGTGNNTIEPSHGTRVVNTQTPAGQTVTYTHNGDSATSDTFQLTTKMKISSRSTSRSFLHCRPASQ